MDESRARRRRPKHWDGFQRGFSPVLADTRDGDEDRFRPRVAVQTIDSKRHLVQFRHLYEAVRVTMSERPAAGH